MKKSLFYFSAILLPTILTVLFFGCQAKRGPSTPYDLPFTPTPTQIAHVYGPVNVFVEDKGIGVPNLTVEAIPPSGGPTYSQSTTASGIASFNPPYLELGNWTFVIPAQTPFPFAPSTLTMAVTDVNQTANFNSAGATLQLTPPVPAAYSATSGGVFVYGLNYIQPGSLLVPVKLRFPSFPTNWSAGYGPATVGYTSSDTTAVTVTGASCVDQSVSFAVTALDLEPTPYPRASSATQIITKNFTSTVTVSWNTTGLNNNFCSNGTGIGIIYGTLNVSTTNGCSSSAIVTVSWNTGNCCYNQFQTPNGTIGASNCSGGSLQFGPGSYNCEVDSGATWGSINVSFRGQSKTTNFPTSGSAQFFSASY